MQEDKGGVEHLKNKLYSRQGSQAPQDIRAPLEPSDAHAPVAWSDSAVPAKAPKPVFLTPERRMAFSTKFFIGSAVFFVLAAAGAAAFFFAGGNYVSSQNIDMQIVAP
ncbi:MAG: hypothetical protein UY71_C0045G0001, partial [Parcubacteria group bacterium GW2011_GWB1_52_7]